MALLGGVAGFALHAAVVYACDCVDPSWTLARVAISSTNEEVSHDAHWPQEAMLWGYDGGFHVESLYPAAFDSLACYPAELP